MDPVDTAILWAKYAQRRVTSTLDNITNSDVLVDTSEFINKTTDSIFDFYKDKLPGRKSPVPQIDIDHGAGIGNFLNNNKKLISFLLGGAIVGGIFYNFYFKNQNENIITIRNNKKYIKTNKTRRAKRLKNGARTNVVIIIGSPLEPLIRIVANDLEKRGFIVYITAINEREIQEINAENSEDIRAFKLDSLDEETLNTQIESFGNTINGPVVPFAQAKAHHLKLIGVLIVPDLYYPVGPVENIGLKGWSDCLNAKIMSPLVLFSNKFVNVIRKNNSIEFGDKSLNVMSTKLIFLSPNLVSSINLPFHAPETVAINSLNYIFESFAREIITDNTLNLQVISLKIGALNIFNHSSNKDTQEKIKIQLQNQILGWGDHMKAIYGSNFKHICLLSGPSPNIRGANLRELNYKIFDLLYSDINSSKKVTYKRDLKIAHVGRGSRSYDFLGKYLPHGLISWFLGCNSLQNMILSSFG
ncbi:hypothetical protein DASC09_010960 [Saccharomycopsis crataegensis]|uniref:DUF1776-domain-containing protein n=1 Tax=Saccharomycopsis crataegensis TaxID=43959 RepID=A0AAV5QGC6_9ASCO|nr:hypothetical protein DASC09_010960 [Saccharomycopsis crataegensis]